MSRFGKIMLAAMAMGLALAPSGMSQPAPVPRATSSRKQRLGLLSGAGLLTRGSLAKKGAGITMAQQKRAAKKARNVKRYRAACR